MYWLVAQCFYAVFGTSSYAFYHVSPKSCWYIYFVTIEERVTLTTPPHPCNPLSAVKLYGKWARSNIDSFVGKERANGSATSTSLIIPLGRMKIPCSIVLYLLFIPFEL